MRGRSATGWGQTGLLALMLLLLEMVVLLNGVLALGFAGQRGQLLQIVLLNGRHGTD